MGFKNGDRVRYSHTNGLVQESTVLATRLDDFCIVGQSVADVRPDSHWIHPSRLQACPPNAHGVPTDLSSIRGFKVEEWDNRTIMPDDSVSGVSQWSHKRPAEWWPEDEGYRGWCRRSQEYGEYREYREHRVRVVVKVSSEGEAQEAMVKKARWHGHIDHHFVEDGILKIRFKVASSASSFVKAESSAEFA